MYYTRLEYTTTYLKKYPCNQKYEKQGYSNLSLSYMCTRSPALGILELETIVVSCGTNDIIHFRHLIDV